MPERVDCLIVGAGVAGLTAGALLARSGRRVAVFDKHSKLGGYAQYFGQDPTFDAATHVIGGCGEAGWTHRALDEAGVLDRIELLRLNPVYAAVFPGHQYLASGDPKRFLQDLCALWPGEAPGIQRFFGGMEELGRDYLSLVDGLPADGVYRKEHNRTLARYVGECTRDPELRAALSALWVYAGLPPERLSVLHYSMLWHTMHHQGAAAVKGGVRMLTSSLADVVTENGGIVETRRHVDRILRNRGQVTGATLDDGREFAANHVISTASPHDTFEELLAAEGQNAAGYPPLRQGFVFSISSIQVHLLVNGPLEPPARSTILHTTYDQEQAFQELQSEKPRFPALVCTVLDHQDAERVPDGKHMVSLFALAPYSRGDNWNVPFDLRRTKEYRLLPGYVELKERIGDDLVAAAETLFPGLSQRIEKRKIGTPITLERYTFNTGGAAFGWANIPEQAGPYRPGPLTPFSGLYLAGHWTFPGGSIAGAVTSGRIAAKVVQAFD